MRLSWVTLGVSIGVWLVLVQEEDPVEGTEEISKKKEQWQDGGEAWGYLRGRMTRLSPVTWRDRSEGQSTHASWLSAFEKCRQLVKRNLVMKGRIGVLENTRVMG